MALRCFSETGGIGTSILTHDAGGVGPFGALGYLKDQRLTGNRDGIGGGNVPLLGVKENIFFPAWNGNEAIAFKRIVPFYYALHLLTHLGYRRWGLKTPIPY